MRLHFGRFWLHFGRRVGSPLIRRQPAGDAYWRDPIASRRLAYLHPVRSIRVWLVGPVFAALSIDPKAAR